MTQKRTLLILSLSFFVLFPFKQSFAATLTYPGNTPCDTSLQACINAAANGNTIELASNNRINESLSINKSLTLTAATGFTPKIGSTTSLLPKGISVQDAGSANAVSVLFKNLKFDNANITLTFNTNAGNSFTLQDSSISNPDDHNNTYGIELNLDTSSTILLQHNTISTSGKGISIGASLNPADVSHVTLLGNIITSTSNQSYSYQGIRIDNTFKGELTLDIHSNLITQVGGCNCGGPAGIETYHSGTGETHLNILNNTIDQIGGTGSGIIIQPLGVASGPMFVNIFNNSISNASDFGIILPAADNHLIIENDHNNFYQNENGQDWGGYTPGENTSSENPLFMNTGTADYRLQNSSPLINAGTSNVTGVSFPERDAHDESRPVSEMDIGAYEANADLQLALSVASNSNVVINDITYIAQIINNGPDSDEANFTATLSSGEINLIDSSQGTCTHTTTVTCSLGTIAASQSSTVIINVEATEEGSLNIAGQVNGNRPDADTSNNSDALGDINTNLISDVVNAASTGGGCQLAGNAAATKASHFFISLSVGLFFLLGLKRKLQQQA